MQQQYSDNPLDKQFRDKLSGSAVQPPKRVWNRIAGNIEQTNHRKTIGTRLLYISLGAVAAAVIATTVLFVPGITTQTKVSNHSTSRAVNTKQFNKETANPASQASIQSNASAPVGGINNKSLVKTPVASETTQSHVSQSKINQTAVSQQLVKLNSNLQTSLFLLKKTLSKIDNNPVDAGNQREDILPIAVTVKGLPITSSNEIPHLIEGLPDTNLSNNLVANELSTSEKAKVESSVCVKGLYAGTDFVLNNTWLIDKKALANYDFKYKVTLGKTVGVKVGYNISNYLGIETGCNIIAEEGQEYTFSPPVFARVEPSNLDNRVKLTYTQIPLLAKFKFAKTSGLTHHAVVLNCNIGAQYGTLHTVTNTVSDENAEYANFKRSELAAVAGAGYDIYLSSRLFISTGLQVSYSSNLYSNTPVSPYDQFSSPHSLVGGVYLGINYAITRCR